MVATRGRTFKRPWRRSCHSSKLKSSSAPIGRKDSWCFHAVGSSNAPLLGSTAAEGLQRIGRTSIATRWRSCGSPQSASCSENFVIPPNVFGQTLMKKSFDSFATVGHWQLLIFGRARMTWNFNVPEQLTPNYRQKLMASGLRPSGLPEALQQAAKSSVSRKVIMKLNPRLQQPPPRRKLV